MNKATVVIKGISPFQQSRMHNTDKNKNESNDAYEERTWKNRAHVVDGKIVHPGGALKQALIHAAGKKYESVDGKGQHKYKGFFESGIMVRKNLEFNKKEDDIYKVAVFGSSTGSQGGKGGRRVLKYFPTIEDWEATCEIVILDNTISEKVLRDHLDYAGVISGIGTWRPQNGGDNGRFVIKLWNWEEDCIL